MVFVPGNIGEGITLKILDVEKDQIIQMGNFVGFMLEKAHEKGDTRTKDQLAEEILAYVIGAERVSRTRQPEGPSRLPGIVGCKEGRADREDQEEEAGGH